jgi:predicted anti-sigma-YlaC factor YlaD
MRQLANESTRKALDAHQKRQHLAMRIAGWFLVVIAVLAGATVAVLGHHVHPLLSYAGYGIIAIGAFVAGKRILSHRRAPHKPDHTSGTRGKRS